VILTTGVLEGLKKKYPHCKIDLLLGERASEIFLKDPRLRQTIVYNKKAPLLEKLKLLRNLKRKKYDLVVDLRQTFISYILGKRVLRSSRFQGHRYLKHNSSLKKFFSLPELKELKPKIY
jgi:ADP-heptose:LPS heptosyltransferase